MNVLILLIVKYGRDINDNIYYIYHDTNKLKVNRYAFLPTPIDRLFNMVCDYRINLKNEHTLNQLIIIILNLVLIKHQIHFIMLFHFV